MAVSYIPLEGNFIQSIGGNTGNITTINNPSLFSSASLIYTFAFVVIVVTASFRYAYAGMLRMQASEKGIRDSKEEFARVTYGLVGVFSLWLILYTVNKDMLLGDVGLSGLRTANVVGGSGGLTQVVPKAGNTSAINNPSIPTNNTDPDGWNAIKNDSQVRANLLNLNNGGISINRTVCNNPTASGCTTVGGLPPETLTMLSQLRSVCSGVIEITGGSETAGHTSHGPGKTPVDLSMNKQGGLNDCVEAFPKSSRVPKNATGGPLCWPNKVYEKFGYVFCNEMGGTPHWHVFKS